jgi:hypothetical protein
MQLLQFAMSQGADIQKLQQLMELQERWEANQARKAFEASMSQAKAEIKPIIKNREVDFQSKREGAGRTNYEYEDYAAVAEHVDPILAKYGLNCRHRPKQDGNKLTIICKLAHRDGHFEETELTVTNDESGNKNSIQSIGSAATYLQRYTLKLALGLAAKKDDDGRATGKQKEQAPAPDGYDNWKADMTLKAEDGFLPLMDSWQKSKRDYRLYVVKHEDAWWSALKTQAEGVKA